MGCDPNEIKSSIDIAPKSDDQFAVASVSGKIIAVGDQKNPRDPNHSIVKIREDETELIFEFMHLDQIPQDIKVGKKVKAGDIIGKASMEVPPGGFTTGKHIHLTVRDKTGNPIPIDGFSFSGWTVSGDSMTKPGEATRNASIYHRNLNETADGQGNDLSEETTKAVLGVQKRPIPPIEQRVKQESINPTPTVVKKETPTPARVPIPAPTKEVPSPVPTEKRIEQGWVRFKSSALPYQIDYPSDWKVYEDYYNGVRNVKDNEVGDQLQGGVVRAGGGGLVPTGSFITTKSIPSGLTLNEYKEQEVSETRRFYDNDLHVKDAEAVYVDGQKAWKIEYAIPDFDHSIYYLFIKEGKAWKIHFMAHDSIFDKELPGFQKVLASFTLLSSAEAKKPNPTPTPKTPEGKIAISKKPEELFRVLLTTPFPQDEPIGGLIPRGNSVGNLDTTAQALKAVGQVNIALLGDGQGFDVPRGAISYTVFPDSSGAKAAYDVVLTNGIDKRDLGFGYPSTSLKIPTIVPSIKINLAVLQYGNVMVTTGFSSPRANFDAEPAVVGLAKVAVKHLQKVGR